MNIDDKYDILKSLSQGQKFIYKDEQYMKLSEHVECYGNATNAINLKTGTMIYLNPNTYIDISTLIPTVIE